MSVGFYLSLAASTPGSSLPSRNSREAPPPVEICVILSPKPRLLTAAAESPPPIIVVASASKYGDYFAGAVGSTMWLDDLKLIYDESELKE